MSNISPLWDDPQVKLIEKTEKAIRDYSLKETIDCLISAIEVNQEGLPDESERMRDLDLIKAFLEAVSGAAEDLSEDTQAGLGCKQIRRRARDRFLINIADVKVA